MIPKEICQIIASKWLSKYGNNRDITKKTGTDSQDQAARKDTSSSSDHFGSPPKKPEIRDNQRETPKKKSRDPQYR